MQIGDRIALTAKFLKNTGQFTGRGGARRGTYLGPHPTLGSAFAAVRWDDEDLAYLAEQYGDDYAANVKEHGQAVLAANICKVGSPKFACNDL